MRTSPDSSPDSGPDSSAVVTGGARGIGRAIGEELVARGYRVVLTDIDGEAVARTADDIGAALGLAHDVRDPEAHRRVAQAADALAPLAAWFNNAGVGDDGRLAALSEEQIRRLVEVNLLGCLWGMRAALEALGARGGDIVNTASLAGLGPVPGYGAYAATKAAVVSATASTHAETTAGVRVHCVCPDGVDTPMLAEQDPDGLGAQLVHSGGRILAPEEVARRAVGLLGSSRVVLTIPAWRGGVMRAAALAPGPAARATSLFAAQGRRALRRR